jgi:hypothetical protein
VGREVGRQVVVILARVVKYGGFAVLATFVAGAAVFTAGYALTDPGGWVGGLAVAAWLLPLAVLTILAALRPADAGTALAIATGTVVLVDLIAVVVGAGWASVEDRLGPVRAVATFTVAGPLAVLGLRRPAAAGRQLLVLGLATTATSLTGWAGSSPMRAVGTVTLAAGLLFLLADGLTPRRRQAGRPAGHPSTAGSADPGPPADRP